MESSAFGLIMLLSRIAGIAPCSLESGQHWLVDILVTLYGFILVTGISVRLIITILLRVLNNTMPLRTFNIMHDCCEILMLTIIVVGGYSSLRRMKLMTRTIKQLEQIEKKFSYCQTPDDKKTSCRTLNIIFVIYIFVSAVLRLVQCRNLYKSEDSILYVIQYWIKQYIAVALEMQLAALAGRILFTLRIINVRLQNLLPHQSFSNGDTINEFRRNCKVAWEETTSVVNSNVYDSNNTNINNPRNEFIIGMVQRNKVEGMEYKIRDVSASYLRIADLIEDWITSDGLLITVILINHMAHFEWLSFSIIENLNIFKSEFGFVETINACIIAVRVLGLMVFIEPFHQTHQQVERTQLLVQFLMVAYRECKPVTNELELFMRVMILQRISYSPLNLFNLNRPLLIKILSSLLTYLVISVTYGMKQEAE